LIKHEGSVTKVSYEVLMRFQIFLAFILHQSTTEKANLLMINDFDVRLIVYYKMKKKNKNKNKIFQLILFRTLLIHSGLINNKIAITTT
jgi:hypothetical protein